LAKGVNELADYNPVIVAGSKLLKQVQNDRLAPFHQLQWLTLLAKIRLMCHEYQQALATLQVALELSLQEHDTGTQIKIHRLFSQGYAAIEDFENAIYHFEAADHLMIDLRKQQHKHTVLTLKANYQDKAFEVLLVDELYNHEQLQNQVVTDQLTQLGNRQALTKLEQVLRNQSRLNVAMLDIDYFKKYNDYYGHLAGDELLYQFAKLLHHVFPASHVIRYGGEEFTVIDSQMDETVFVGKLQQFQSALNQQAFAHEGVAPMAIVTVSIGYVQMKEAMPLEKLIAQADTALYQAKNSGRNCLKGYA
ncbi:MAG: GGDEF domain-containing protein, partial [Culicoidibacterales bacterium]